MKKYKQFLLALLAIIICSCSTDDEKEQYVETEAVPVRPIDASNVDLPAVIFTDPQQILAGSESPVIINRLISYINAALGGSSIYSSIYLFEHAKVIKAFKNAHSREVKVHIAVDNSSRSNNRGTINELTSLGEGVQVVEVNNDTGSSSIQHNKFVIFSELETENGSLNNIVFQTSHNFIKSGMKKIQDAVIFSNKDLFDSYYNYWLDMEAFSAGGMKNYNYTEFKNPSEGIGVQFHPKRRNEVKYGEDPVIDMLNNITDPSTTTVKIGMSAWSDSRSYILDKLLDLSMNGADIQVITKDDKGPKVIEGLKRLEENGAFVKLYSMGSTEGKPKINIHLKLMMIEGNYEGNRQNIIMTGTQNFTNNAIWNNNETSLFLYNHQLYEKYENYYNELKDLPGIENH